MQWIVRLDASEMKHAIADYVRNANEIHSEALLNVSMQFGNDGLFADVTIRDPSTPDQKLRFRGEK